VGRSARTREIGYDMYSVCRFGFQIVLWKYAIHGDIGSIHPEMAQFSIGKHHNECIKRSKYPMVPIGI
jgi:hypothetical protein